MATPPKGRADYYAAGDWNAMCFRCGRKRKASTLKKQWQGYYVCPEHWEPRQPQDFVRGISDNPTAPWSQPWPVWEVLYPSSLQTEAGGLLLQENGGQLVI